ncbi:MAG: HEAT repeat domain-containing protein [Halobacteriota archaeon]
MPVETATGLAEAALVYFGVGLLILLAAVATLTIGRSVAAVRPRRYERRRYPELYIDAYTRSVQPDPKWDEFVDSLSKRDGPVIREVLDSLLRTLRGRERRELQAAAQALDINEEARKRLRKGSPREKRQALGWLVLLEESLPPTVLHRHCRSDDALAGGARLLYACGHPDAKREGTELLFSDADQTLTVFGEDTLYRLHQGDGTRLVRQAGRRHDGWRPAFVIQVLTVIRHVTPAHSGVSLSWIYELVESPYREVRTAAAAALSQYGHHDDVRSAAPIDRLCSDPDAEVRKTTYETLAVWNDHAARSRLATAAIDEPDDRARLVAVRFLAEARSLGTLDRSTKVDSDLRATVEWVRAERAALGGTT